MGSETDSKNEENKKSEKSKESDDKNKIKKETIKDEDIEILEVHDDDDDNYDVDIDEDIMKHLKELEDDLDEENKKITKNDNNNKDDDDKKNNEIIFNEFDRENDKEFMKIFRSKIKLDDGTEEYLFSIGLRSSRILGDNSIFYSKSLFPINCHLCKCCISGELKLREHFSSQSHKKLAKQSINAKEYRKAFAQPNSYKFVIQPIKIYPGENIKRITPEYYDRLLPIKECNFKPIPPRRLYEELIDDPIHDYNRNAPILGLCYAFKMKYDERRILYFCTLCNRKIQGEAYQHFVGAGHQADYILRHFKHLHSSISEKLEEKITNSLKRRKAVRDIFRVLYRKIEQIRGQRKISIIDFIEFNRAQKKFILACRNPLIQYHYNENTIDFPDYEIKSLIDKAIKGEHIIDDDPISIKDRKKTTTKKTISPIPPKSISTPIAKKRGGGGAGAGAGGVGGGGVGVDSGRNSGKRSNPSNSLATEIRKRSSPPKAQIDDSPIAWDRYKRMLGATLDDLDEKYEKYEENPESHPKYASKWKNFWRERVRELEKDFIDPEKYDFKPEWQIYWSGLLKKYYDMDVGRCKYDIKKSLKLSLHKRSPSPIRRRKLNLKIFSSNVLRLSRSRSPRTRSLLQSRSIQSRSPPSIIIDKRSNYNQQYYEQEQQQQQQYHQIDYQQQHQGHHRRRDNSNKSRHDDNIDNINYESHHNERHHQQHHHHHLDRRSDDDIRYLSKKRERSRSPLSTPVSLSKKRPANERRPAEPTNVVSILRLLTAVEDQLGSLGPKAIDFLGKAVLFEKENNRNSNELLKDTEYYMFFMTSMEKLKGQIFADVVPSHKIRPVKNVIQDMEILIRNFDEYKRKNNVVFGPGIGTGSGTGNQYSLPSSSSAQPQMQMNSYRGGGGVSGGNDNNQQMQMQQQKSKSYHPPSSSSLLIESGGHNNYPNDNYRNANNSIGNNDGGNNGSRGNSYMSGGLQDVPYNQQYQRYSSSGPGGVGGGGGGVGGGSGSGNYFPETNQYNDPKLNSYNRMNNDGGNGGGYMKNSDIGGGSGGGGGGVRGVGMEMMDPRGNMKSNSNYYGSDGYDSYRGSGNNVVISPSPAKSSGKGSMQQQQSQSHQHQKQQQQQQHHQPLSSLMSNTNLFKSGSKLTTTKTSSNSSGFWQKGNNNLYSNPSKDNFTAPSSSSSSSLHNSNSKNPFRKNAIGKKETNIMMDSGNNKNNMNTEEELICPSPPSFYSY